MMSKANLSTEHLQLLIDYCGDWLSDFYHLMDPKEVKALSGAIKAGKRAVTGGTSVEKLCKKEVSK